MTSLGHHARTAGQQLARASTQIGDLVRDLNRLAQAAQRADTRMARVGGTGAAGMRRYRQETSRTRDSLKSIAVLLSGGALTMGAADVFKEGAQYQQAMNAFGATTNATRSQMQRASAVANQLGNDLRLPGATAADAAEAMVELAKAGFRTDQAISATRASLVMASAAQVNAADSAKYLGDMMDQFGMGADQASRAADILAATANSASGDIIDIYYAMKYAGPVAHGLGVTMQEAASAVGMLGKAGILGQTAGTTLRGMFANLAAPTPQMIEGLKAMGIQAWDAEGRFKGLRYVIDGLSKAQDRMTQKDFAAAVKKSMGKPAMSGAIALAHQGTDSFDALMQAVSETGAASEIAAAKGKGLAGAILQLKTQARQTGLTIYEGLAPGLEYLVRGVTSGMSKANPKIEKFFDYFNDSATLFGPELGAAARREFGGIASAVKDLSQPLKNLGGQAVADFLHVLINAGAAAMTVLRNLARAAAPVADAFNDMTGKSNVFSSALDTVVYVLDLAFSAISSLSGVLLPIGRAVGSLVSAFAALPGPVQQFVMAALLVSRIQPRLASLASTVSGRVTGSFRTLGEQMAVQRSLAAAAGQSLSRYGAAMAVLQTRVPMIGRMGDSFRTASASASGFAGTLRGVTAAAGTGLRGAMGGLMGVMGGPWGLALTGATVALGMLAASQQKAAEKAAEHKARIDGLTQALVESNGAIDQNVRRAAAQDVLNAKLAGGSKRLVDFMGALGYTVTDLTDSYLGQGESIDGLANKMSKLGKAKLEEASMKDMVDRPEETKQLAAQAAQYEGAAQALRSMSGDAKTAAKNAKDLNSAVKGAGGTTAYDRLKVAVKQLADETADADSRTRALRSALDLLSGGSVSLQAAQARVNQAITDANEAMKDGIADADGYGKALVNANGTLNTTTKNGQHLFETFNTIADGASNAAVAAFSFAKSQGKELPESIYAARVEMEQGRDAVLKLAESYGIGKKEAAAIADSMGLIPGKVAILLSTEGAPEALADLLAVQAEYERFPDRKTIKVEALGEDAQRELEQLGYKIEMIPGTREYKVTAPTAEARAELERLITTMSRLPGTQSVKIDAKTRAAITDLEAVKTKVSGMKGKTLTMRAPTAEARKQLEELGFKIKSTKGKDVIVTVPTGGPKQAVRDIQSAINSLRGKSITNTVTTLHRNEFYKVPLLKEAHGGTIDYYARGGIRAYASGGTDPGDRPNQHVAQIAQRGTYRVWAEDETDGEGYVPFRRSARPRSRAITEEIVRRLGGDPRGIQWNAAGSVTDWRYDPQTGSLYSPSDAGQAGHKTKKVKGKDVEYFDLAAVEKKLISTGNATVKWTRDLEKVAEVAGVDVAQALASMGQDGIELTRKMANGSAKYIAQMSTALRNLAKTARASLTSYRVEMTHATLETEIFTKNLATLAGRGYGDLAAHLAAQNDETARQLAAAAVGDAKKAAAANTAAKKANQTLSSEQIEQLVQIIAAISTNKTGIHDVAGKTGLGEDEIIAVANKAKAQIQSSLGSRATKFVADLAAANRGMAYANGGIRAGIYATQAGLIRWAEPETGGEAYLPLSPTKRRHALPVLADVARRFGLGLTDAQAGRPVVIVRSGDTTQVTVTPVRTGATASDIATQVGRQIRRARRGGVAARAA
ncbi:phage tail tape measure protein [Streptomyces sp. AD55]|uniref:phage tail tape measure protein n=1 Tax=Streptomyces sp. AD55 TaxID=3242895 RepID=UPI0035291B05